MGNPWSELGNHTAHPGQLRFQNPKGGFPARNGEDLSHASMSHLSFWGDDSNRHIGYPCELLCLPVFDTPRMWVMDVAWLHHHQRQSRSSSSSRILLVLASSFVVLIIMIVIDSLCLLFIIMFFIIIFFSSVFFITLFFIII